MLKQFNKGKSIYKGDFKRILKVEIIDKNNKVLKLYLRKGGENVGYNRYNFRYYIWNY